MEYTVFPTTLGWMAVAGSGRGVAAIALPSATREGAVQRLLLSLPTVEESPREVDANCCNSLPERLIRYMRGDRIRFPDDIDTTGWTDFRARIWNATRLIPYGQTRSYSWVAATAGKPRASRATGQALHHNPVPVLVPCHRVVGANGDLVGFGGGLALKQQLLRLERGPGEASLDAVHSVAENAG